MFFPHVSEVLGNSAAFGGYLAFVYVSMTVAQEMRGGGDAFSLEHVGIKSKS